LAVILLPTALMLVVVIYSQATQSRVGGVWIFGLLICLLLFLPSYLFSFDDGSIGAFLERDQNRIWVFNAGLISTFTSLVLTAGYFIVVLNQPEEPSYEANPAMFQQGNQNIPSLDQPFQQILADPPGFTGLTGQTDLHANGSSGNIYDGATEVQNPQQPLNEVSYATASDSAPTLNQTVGSPRSATHPRIGPIRGYLVNESLNEARYELFREHIVIGRGTGYEISLDDPAVSRKGHVALRLGQSGYIAQDLGNAPALCLLNGQPLRQPIVLVHGDHISVGNTTLRYIDATQKG